jgi:MFS family permease
LNVWDIAKLADVFGRNWAYLGCVVFFTVGYIVVACSQNIVTYAVGNSIYIRLRRLEMSEMMMFCSRNSPDIPRI